MSNISSISSGGSINRALKKVVEKEMKRKDIYEAREYVDFLKDRYDEIDDSMPEVLTEEDSNKLKAKIYAGKHYNIAKLAYKMYLREALSACQTDPAEADSLSLGQF